MVLLLILLMTDPVSFIYLFINIFLEGQTEDTEIENTVDTEEISNHPSSDFLSVNIQL